MTYYCSHISKKLITDIRPLKLQFNDKSEFNKHIKELRKKYNISETYSSSIYAFPNIVSYENIMLLVNNGFKPWEFDDKLYIYNFNLETAVVKRMSVFSTEEELDYISKKWKSGFTKKQIEEYKAKKIKYLKSLGLLDVTKEEYLKSNNSKKYRHLDKYFKLNIKEGNRRQYASVIPHLQLIVDTPIKYDFVNVMDKKYYIGYINKNKFYIEGDSIKKVLLNRNNYKHKVKDYSLIELIDHYFMVNDSNINNRTNKALYDKW